MKQIITIIAFAFFFITANASVVPYKAPININTEKATLKISLQAAGKVNIMWTALAAETTTTIYEIQKKIDGNEFKTIALLMGESFPTYSFRDKITISSGVIEYRVVVVENNIIVNTVSQNVVVL
jgi:hypothetical protein